jgi:hypothetical protein
MKFRAAKKYLNKRIRALKCNSTDRVGCKTACCIDCRDICGGVCREAYCYMVGYETGCQLLQARENLETIRRIQNMRRKRP